MWPEKTGVVESEETMQVVDETIAQHTFQQVVRAEAFAILGISAHLILKLIHVSGNPADDPLVDQEGVALDPVGDART